MAPSYTSDNKWSLVTQILFFFFAFSLVEVGIHHLAFSLYIHAPLYSPPIIKSTTFIFLLLIVLSLHIFLKRSSILAMVENSRKTYLTWHLLERDHPCCSSFHVYWHLLYSLDHFMHGMGTEILAYLVRVFGAVIEI